MPDIEYYRRTWERTIISDKFKNSFDANAQLCKDVGGKYSKEKYFSGEDHQNTCALPNGVKILGWKDCNRFDIIENNKDIIFDADTINTMQYRMDEEIMFRWGVKAMTRSEEGIHGSVSISKKKGLENVGISDFRSNCDTPFFTIYNKG